MARYIDADKMVSKDNAYTTFPHDLAGCDDNDLVRWINEQPTADVVPKSEVEISQYLLKEAWKRIEELDELCGELQKSKTEVARELFDEIIDALRGEIDEEDKRGRAAWDVGDTTGYQIHQYAEEKLETIVLALQIYKKHTEEKNDDEGTD